MGVASLFGRSRRVPAEPVAVLLGDPATVHAATDALAQTERRDEPAWPFVVSVGLETVTLGWAGISVPAPREPWRLGANPRTWTIDRALLEPVESAESVASVEPAGPRGVRPRPVLIGRFGDAIVFVNTSRAPGPLCVEAAPGPAPRGEQLRALIWLIASQSAGPPPEPGDVVGERDGARVGERVGERVGAWWPVDVAGETISLLGTPIGITLSVELMRRAAELAGSSDVRPPHAPPERKPAAEPVRQPELKAEPVRQQPVAPPTAPPTAPLVPPPITPLAAPPVAPPVMPSPVAPPPVEPAREPRDEEFEDWLRQVRMAATGGVVLRREVAVPQAISNDVPHVAPGVEDTAQIPKIVIEDEDQAAPEPIEDRIVAEPEDIRSYADADPASTTDPDPEDDDDDLADWAADFAVSSAEGTSPR
jgi:hypothetical protein